MSDVALTDRWAWDYIWTPRVITAPFSEEGKALSLNFATTSNRSSKSTLRPRYFHWLWWVDVVAGNFDLIVTASYKLINDSRSALFIPPNNKIFQATINNPASGKRWHTRINIDVLPSNIWNIIPTVEVTGSPTSAPFGSVQIYSGLQGDLAPFYSEVAIADSLRIETTDDLDQDVTFASS